MIASKVVCDDTYSNQSWCVVGQKMFNLKEVNQMEREMCGYLEWNLVSFTRGTVIGFNQYRPLIVFFSSFFSPIHLSLLECNFQRSR